MEDYLDLWVNMVIRYQPHYFILFNDQLIYCETKGGKQLGSIHLQIAQIEQSKNNSLEIIIHSGLNKIQIKCQNQEEKDRWLGALQKNNMKNKNNIDYDSQIYQLEKLYGKLNQKLNNIDNKSSLYQLKDLGKQLSFQVTQIANTIIKEKTILENLKETVDPDKNTEFLSFLNENQSEIDSPGLQNYDNQIKSLISKCKNSQPQKYKLLTQNEFFKNYKISQEKTRDLIRVKRNPDQKIDFWKILKDAIGKDLTKITMPVNINEPMSTLQRTCEQFSHAYLIQKAADQKDGCMKLAYIIAQSAFQINSTAYQKWRKPFNSLLGETYEYIDTKQNCKIIGEQISHHPPVSATFCDSKDYSITALGKCKISFGGTYIELIPQGLTYVNLKNTDELITYSKNKTSINNLFFGEMVLFTELLKINIQKLIKKLFKYQSYFDQKLIFYENNFNIQIMNFFIDKKSFIFDITYQQS